MKVDITNAIIGFPYHDEHDRIPYFEWDDVPARTVMMIPVTVNAVLEMIDGDRFSPGATYVVAVNPQTSLAYAILAPRHEGEDGTLYILSVDSSPLALTNVTPN